ncbi:hypothetical protein Ade02nite_48310 [Paractinoplanes deccanensis]|uniref:CAAX prenyl protease 2/Lysostaphin resistance protein A-like domain-containing protein n=1 Tax=Paractinoplanes deccanensis TaxID=113561 RepID=A0ABQ3Y859_9ACTN|nr:CPBP family intramembrane glutamic endopeptidase [Actinoplanes deccanensis]GID76190.1 hypothetical protein Ade02nite_48310 [Actinoplanes deccanensis]
MLAELLVALLVLGLLIDVADNVIRPGRAMAQVEAKGRVWFYRRFLLGGWMMVFIAFLAVVDSSDLTFGSLGLAWSGGGVGGRTLPGAVIIAWVLTALALGALVRNGIRARRMVLAGASSPARDRAAAAYPRTPRERRLAAAVAVTAGITEEVVHRGLFLAAGVLFLDLPLAVAAAAGIALFAAGHLYQGAQGVYSAAFLGAVFTGVTLLSGSLLPAIVLHVVFDLIAFFLIPPPPLRPEPSQPSPETQSAPAPVATAPETHSTAAVAPEAQPTLTNAKAHLVTAQAEPALAQADRTGASSIVPSATAQPTPAGPTDPGGRHTGDDAEAKPAHPTLTASKDAQPEPSPAIVPIVPGPTPPITFPTIRRPAPGA